MNRTMTRVGKLGLLLSCVGIAAVSACVPQTFCAKRQECDTALDRDSEGVCIEVYNANISALRANAEPECHELANATLDLDACRSSLDCDDFEEADLGQQCDEPLDRFNDAVDDTRRGGENRCSAAN